MASSSSSPPEKYPFPSEVSVENFVPFKLSETNHSVWQPLMLGLIETFDLVGFIHDKPPGANDIQYKAWKRSDALLRSWILGTVDQDLLPHVVRLTTAKKIWKALQKMLHPQGDYRELPAGENVGQYLPLLKAAVSGDWKSAKKFLEQRPDAVEAAITASDQTALMVALRSLPGINFVKKLVDLMSREDLEVVDCFGRTALHHAAARGKVEGAKLVVSKNPDLPNIGDTGEDLPIRVAARCGRREMVLYLMGVTEEDGKTKPFEGEPGVKFVNDLIYRDLYDIALSVVQRFPKLARVKSSPLKVLALRRSAFLSGTSLNSWQRLTYSYVPMKLENFANNCRDVENPANGFISVSQKVCAVFWKGIEILVPHYIKDVQQTKLRHHQALQLVKHLCKEVATFNMTEAYNFLREPLRLATSVGIPEVVEEICDSIPGVIDMKFLKETSVFHMAITNRQENIFNLIYQFTEGERPTFVMMCDELGNNCLHLAGELNSEQKLNIRASAAGAALQMQRELQWFKVINFFSN
ncbi:hypothetical protein F0562_025844 [Nyssa sinensis]|uniref:Uncharacterized protein n=1 Tax=Nyssa sinensis TaxID=561372 RepID=A0A5J5BB89_9ASTE|nr:hypothetical protein F0562_025844 [Nyssa sinensis]